MLIATATSVCRLDPNTNDGHPQVLLQATGIARVEEGMETHVAALEDGGIVLVRGDDVLRFASLIDEPITSLLLLGEEPLRLLVGTEAPHLYQIEGDGPATRNVSFAGLECRGQWHTPWGGPAALRSLARTRDGWVYADIHVGSIMRSADEGATWEPVTPSLHEDVHQVATCPAVNERVYATTFLAAYVSNDRGMTWEHRAVDLGERYGRAMAVHPRDPECLLTTVSDGPHGENVHGRLYRTADGGRTWSHVAEGFPQSTPDNIDTFHVAFSEDGLAWATVGSDLYVGREQATQWSKLWEAPGPIQMLSCRAPATD